MIQANELRIGNYVKFEDRYFQIDTISKELPTLNTTEFGIGVVEWSQIKPIPLTEEILLKCGFVQDTETSYRWYLGEYFTYDLDDGGFKYEGVWIRPLIKYLHELQNLYWCLCNQELKIKL